jgi:hypothetical protein
MEAIKSILDGGRPTVSTIVLLEDLRAKSDGSLGGNPKDDWILDPEAQELFCLMIDELIGYIVRTYGD